MVAEPMAYDADTFVPHDLTAETAVIGSIIIDGSAYYDVMDIVKPADFFLVRNQWVYEAMRSVAGKGATIDYATVTSELRAQGRLQEVTEAYLLESVNATPSSNGVVSYARYVADTAARRRLIDVAGEIVRLAHSEGTPVEDILAQSEAAVLEVDYQGKDNVRRLYDLISAQADEVGKAVGKTAVEGAKTYLESLDKLVVRFEPGNVSVIAARPGMGKTALMVQIAVENAKRGMPVAFFSVEMTAEDIAARVVSLQTNIPSEVMRSKQMTDWQYKQYLDALGSAQSLQDLPIFVDDSAALTPSQMRRTLRKLVRKEGVGLVLVDYLQLMRAPGYRDGGKHQEISEIMQDIKQTAKMLRVPIVIASQLNRSVEGRTDKRPALSDLRESGTIEEVVYLALGLYRDGYYTPEIDDGSAEVIVMKHRNGRTGVAHLQFDGPRTRFLEGKRVDLKGM